MEPSFDVYMYDLQEYSGLNQVLCHLFPYFSEDVELGQQITFTQERLYTVVLQIQSQVQVAFIFVAVFSAYLC